MNWYRLRLVIPTLMVPFLLLTCQHSAEWIKKKRVGYTNLALMRVLHAGKLYFWLIISMKNRLREVFLFFFFLNCFDVLLFKSNLSSASAVCESILFHKSNNYWEKTKSLLDSSWQCFSFPRKSCCDSRFLHLHQFLSGNFLACSLIWTLTSQSGCTPPCFPQRGLQMPCSTSDCSTAL